MKQTQVLATLLTICAMIVGAPTLAFAGKKQSSSSSSSSSSAQRPDNKKLNKATNKQIRKNQAKAVQVQQVVNRNVNAAAKKAKKCSPGKEEICVILVPTQDGTNIGQPYIDTYEDAAKVWPVKKLHFRTTSLPTFAGGTATPQNVADEVEDFVNAMKKKGVTRFILPSSNSIMRAWVDGNTTAMGHVPSEVRHPGDITYCTTSGANRTIHLHNQNGNQYVFGDYFTDFDGTFSFFTIEQSYPDNATVFILFDDFLTRTDLNGQNARTQAKNLYDLYAASPKNFTIHMYGIEYQAHPYDAVREYDPTVGNFITAPVVLGQNLDLGLEVTAKSPAGLHNAFNFDDAGYTDNAVLHDLDLPSDKIFRPGVLYFGFEPAPAAQYTIPENVFFGGSLTGVLNGLNCESLKVGYPTTNCDWDSGVGRAGNGYNIVQMFALLATCEEYCGPENKLKFRENGVQVYPYLIGGGGVVLPANTKALKSDKIIRNPKWENDAVDLLDVVNPQGAFDQDFGFCN